MNRLDGDYTFKQKGRAIKSLEPPNTKPEKFSKKQSFHKKTGALSHFTEENRKCTTAQARYTATERDLLSTVEVRKEIRNIVLEH